MYFDHANGKKEPEINRNQAVAEQGHRIGPLWDRVEALLKDSKDPHFTEYLLWMKVRINDQEQQIKRLSDELDSKVLVYESRMRAQQGRKTGQQPAVEIAPKTPEVTKPAAEAAQVLPEMVTQPAAEIVQEVPEMTKPAVEMTRVSPEAVQPAAEIGQDLPEMTQPAAEVTPKIPEEVQPAADMAQLAQEITQQIPRNVQQKPEKNTQQPEQAMRPARNAEYTIGAAVLSILGSVFVLTAMVLLGFYFMEGLMKGLLLYLACLIVMALSELFLYRRWPKLGMTFSAIGMAGLYISTLVNYLVLKNFNQWVALGITAIITAIIIVLSRKRDAISYRILGMAAMYVCVLTVPTGGEWLSQNGLLQTQLVTITVITFIINVMCIVVPIQRNHTGVSVIHMALHTCFACVGLWAWFTLPGEKFAGVREMWHYPFFAFVAILVVQLIFITQIKWQERQKPGATMEANAGISITYGISTFFFLGLVAETTDFRNWIAAESLNAGDCLVFRLVCTGILVCICLITLFALRARQEKWLAWYAMNLFAIIVHLNGDIEGMEFYICLTVLLVLSKLLSFRKDPMLRISDAVLTSLSCLLVAAGWDQNRVIPLFVVLLLSVLCINYWETYFETILTFTIALYVSWHMLSILKLPVFVGILFVGMLIFNNVERWRGKAIEVYNALMLIGQACAYLMLVNPVYHKAYLTYLCMLVFGVATIVICFQKKYHLDFDDKPLILALFLTYMGAIVRTNYPIVNSILLMLVALLSVGMGFAVRKKAVRIYGLVLSLLICAKLVLYDFMTAGTLQKLIVFFVVGVLALLIAAIYMVLERNQEKIWEQSQGE